MPSFTPVDADRLVNTNTAGGQISPRVVALAGSRYMVIWVGQVTQPVTIVNGTTAGSYVNADIRAQIYNADGSLAGGEIIINTTIAGGQLRPVVTQLADGNVLISWHDGVGPAGGTSETASNTIRAQEFNSSGVAVGSEFVIGNSNGRNHVLAATNDGGFVAVYQQGGVGGALPQGNLVAQVYNSNNIETSNFIVDQTSPFASTSPLVAVESDGDIVVYWIDRDPSTNGGFYRSTRFDSIGTELSGGGWFDGGISVSGVTALATGGHAFIASYNPGNGAPIRIYAIMNSADGSLSRYIDIAEVPAIGSPSTITPLAGGGFLVSWITDSNPGSGFNAEIMVQAFNAIGNPVGSAFQVNNTLQGNQSAPAFVQLADGDIVAAWIDESQLNGDTSGTAIVMNRIEYDALNRAPTASVLPL